MASARYHPLQFLTYFAAKLLRRGHDAMGENEGSLVLLANIGRASRLYAPSHPYGRGTR